MGPTELTSQQLIEGFHKALIGGTVAEQKKSFHSYLNFLRTSANGDPEKVSAVVDGIVPHNFWEGILKVDIILHFHLFQHSLEILKSENKLYTAKLLKNTWFTKKLLDTFTPQQFVNELFSVTSVSTRIRVINKLIKHNSNNEFSKQLFHAYLEKYGLHAAKQLLPMCSVDVIEDITINKKIKLSTSTQHKVIDRNIKLAKHFLKDAKNRKEVKYIASKNLQLLSEILHDSTININGVNFGNAITHKVIKNFKDLVLSKPEKYIDILKQGRMSFDLKDEYGYLIYKLIVEKKIDILSRYWDNYLSPLPKQKRLEIYLNAFKEINKCSLEEKPQYIDETFLNLVEDVDVREKFAQLKYNVDKELTWIKYMRIDKSIPLFKEKLSVAKKPYVRQQIVELLVETCKIHNDNEALLDVLRFVTKRLRNDEEHVRSRFIFSLLNEFKLHDLNKEHWSYINEIEKLFEINGECFLERCTLLNEKIIYHLKKGLPINELLAKHREDLLIMLNYSHRDELNLEKEFILQTASYWNSEPNDSVKFDVCFRLLSAVQSYNSRHPENRIDAKKILPLKWVIQRLEESKETNSYIDALFICYILENSPLEDRHRVIRLFFAISFKLEYKILLHFVKKEPLAIVHYLEDFLKRDAMLEIIQSPKLLQNFKKLAKFDIHQKVIDYYTHCTINGEKEFEEKTSRLHDVIELKSISLEILSVCMSEGDYINLITKYYPDEAHVNTESEESTELYRLRKSICENLHNLNTALTALNTLLKFCIGDYLKFCLKGLYHLFFHTQECKLPSVVNELKVKAVSVRKHAIFLSFATLPRSFVFEFMESYILKEKHVSVVAYALLTTFKYFTRNLDNKFFEFFKCLLRKIDKNDESTLEFITNKCKLPEMFVAQYVEFVWDVLEEFGKNGSEFEDTKFKLLQHLKENDYFVLNNEFLDRIIMNNFLKGDKRNLGTLENVVMRYLFYCDSPDTQHHRVDMIFTILNDYKKSHGSEVREFHEFIARFVEKFASFALRYKLTSTNLVNQFIKYFNDFIDLFESFTEHLILNVLVLHVESISENYVLNFAEKIAAFIDDLELKYEVGAIMYCKDEASNFIKKSIRHYDRLSFEENLYKYLEHFYTSSTGLGVAIITTALLEDVNSYCLPHSETKFRYEDLIEKLKGRTEPVIKLLVQSFLANCYYG